MVGLFLLYIALLIYPNALFSYTYQYQNFEIYSDREIPKEMENVLDEVKGKLILSELYQHTDKFSIYICNNQALFWLFTRNANAGGLVNFVISPNVFIRESDIKANKIVPPKGWMYEANERPLSYFIAHESTHSLERKISPFLIFNTDVAILEGYADYIGKKHAFSFEKYIQLYKNQAFVMNPKNGLYHRYHLYMAYLIEKKGMNFREIVKNKPNLSATLQEISDKF